MSQSLEGKSAVLKYGQTEACKKDDGGNMADNWEEWLARK